MSVSESLLYEMQDGVEVEMYFRDGNNLILELGFGDTGVGVHLTELLFRKIVEAVGEAGGRAGFKDVWEISSR